MDIDRGLQRLIASSTLEIEEMCQRQKDGISQAGKYVQRSSDDQWSEKHFLVLLFPSPMIKAANESTIFDNSQKGPSIEKLS